MKKLNLVATVTFVLGCIAGSANSAPITATFIERHDFTITVFPKPDETTELKWDGRVTGNVRSKDTSLSYNEKSTKQGTPPVKDKLEKKIELDGAIAESSSEFDVQAGIDAPLGSKEFKGFHEVKGKATADRKKDQNAHSRATSKVSYNLKTVDAKGNIKWRPHWVVVSELTGSITESTRNKSGSQDPIDFTVENLDTREVFVSRLFEIDRCRSIKWC